MEYLDGLLHTLQRIIDSNDVNLLKNIFAFFTVTMIVSCCLFSFVETHLPNFIRQTFCYGKHGYKGPANVLLTNLEVPKGWFKHFYVFAFAWASLALIIVLSGLVLNAPAPECVLTFLDFFAGGRNKRQVQVSTTCGLVTTILMTMQCARRFYESNFVQIFSKKSKMNFSQYIVGYIHYFGAITTLLANTEGFVRNSTPTPFSLSRISILQYLCVFIFHYSWTQQHKSNMILVNLRRDKQTGQVLTEQHLLPKGEYFDMISSPHMFFEVVMYLALLGLLPNCTTWYYVSFWVVGNQIFNALQVHKWYQENFKHYPKERYAIIPFVL